MFKYIGIGLMGVFALMAIPGSFDIQTNDMALYGMGNMVLYDAYGNEVFQQSVHNLITDEGETFLIDQAFQTVTVPIGDLATIGAICVSDNTVAPITIGETTTASDFDGSEGYTSITTICEESADNGVGNSGGIATIGPLTIEEGVHVGTGENVVLVGICLNDGDGTPSEAIEDCVIGNGSAGILFAVFEPTSVTLGSGETVDITYTFNIAGTP